MNQFDRTAYEAPQVIGVEAVAAQLYRCKGAGGGTSTYGQSGGGGRRGGGGGGGFGS